MAFDLQQVINRSFPLRLISSLAQRLPPRLGYHIAYGMAEQIARQRDSRLVQAVRANQWVVHSGNDSVGKRKQVIFTRSQYHFGHLLVLHSGAYFTCHLNSHLQINMSGK